MTKEPKKPYSIRLSEDKIKYLMNKYNVDTPTKLLEYLIDKDIKEETPEPKKLKFPLVRVGGKRKIADEIVSLMPAHKRFVDVFGGGLAILYSKEPSKDIIEIVNDKDSEIVNLYEVIKTRTFELREALSSLLSSRKVFTDLKKSRSTDEIERAVRLIYLSRHTLYEDYKTGYAGSVNKDRARYYRRIEDEVLWIADRLKFVNIECMDYKDILRKYDSNDTLFYCDAPYYVRNIQNNYDTEFKRRDGWELSQRLHDIKGMAMVSHYQTRLYDKWYSDFNTYSIETFKPAARLVDGKKPRIIENIYYNFDINK